MPDAAAPSAPLHRRALDALAAAARVWGAVALTPPQLGCYAVRGVVAGWRLTVAFSDGVSRQLDVLADRSFPRSAARIALVDRPPFLEWPHVEKEGALRLLNSASEVSPFAPVAAVEHQLGEASALVEDLIAGRLDGEFRAEFLSYWDWSTTPGAIPVRSLLEPRGPSRVVRVWRGRDEYLVAEADAALQTWLRVVRGVAKPRAGDFDPALLIWRDAPLAPAEYPRSGPALMALAEGEAAAVLREMVAQQPPRLVSLVGFPTGYGLETRSFDIGAAGAGKSVALAELTALQRPGRTILVYHHQTRMRGGHDRELEHWGGRLRAAGFHQVYALRASAYSARTFFLLNAPPEMRARAEAMTGLWRGRLTWRPDLGLGANEQDQPTESACVASATRLLMATAKEADLQRRGRLMEEAMRWHELAVKRGALL